MKSSVQVALVAALALSAASVGGAQWAPEPGHRVRVELRDGLSLTGRVHALTADSVWLRVEGAMSLAAVPRDSLVAFRSSLGRSHGAGARRGARIGALVGGGLGLLVFGAGVAADATGHCGDCFFPASLITGVYGAGLLVVGTTSGLAVGALVGRERWGPRVSVVSDTRR